MWVHLSRHSTVQSWLVALFNCRYEEGGGRTTSIRIVLWTQTSTSSIKGDNSAVAFVMKGVKIHAVNDKGTERNFVCDDSLEILVV
jgi:hypothetical protein